MEKKWWFWVGCFLLTTLIYGWFEMHRQVEEMSEATIEEATQRVQEREIPAEPDSPAKEYEVAPYGELQKKIKAGLVGTHSKCELGPASAQDQAEWVKLQKRREHGRLSSAELFALSDSDLYLEVTSRLQDKQYAVGLGGMSEAERTVYLVSELEFEVVMGGFDQYFGNSSGNCALRARAAARALDSHVGDLVARALAVFPNATPDEDRAVRSQQMDALPTAAEVWPKLELELPHDLSPLVERYIRAHRNEFDCPPQRVAP